MGDELARDEDDHDLLTFNESAIRLREEIAATEAALREDPPRSGGPLSRHGWPRWPARSSATPGRRTRAPAKRGS